MFAAKWCFAEQMNNSSQNKVEYLQKKKMKYVLLYMTKNKESKPDNNNYSWLHVQLQEFIPLLFPNSFA